MMKQTKPRLWVSGAMIVGILCFIWGNSLLPGQDSGELSGFVGMLLQKLLPFLDLQSETGMHLLRKAAHFSEFAALGVSFTWFYGMLSKKRLWALGLPLLSGAAAAAIDETIQIFSPDRGPSVKDVCIDTSGVIAGILVLTLLHWLVRRIKTHKQPTTPDDPV